MPYVGLAATGALSVIIGFVLASAFAAILVFAQELAPDKVGAVSGLFFGFAFGMGGIAAAVLGKFADLYGIEAVYRACARSEEHTSELQSLMRISYAVFCLKKKTNKRQYKNKSISN